MRNVFALLGVAACAAVAIHAQSRYVTLAIGNGVSRTSVTIEANETARLVSTHTRDPHAGYLRVEKNGLVLLDAPIGSSTGMNAWNMPLVVTGPAVLVVHWWTPPEPVEPPYTAFATFEIIPSSFPPAKTVMVPAGTGANIIFEASSDLVRWAPAESGAYTNRTDNLFFRIRAERIP